VRTASLVADDGRVVIPRCHVAGNPLARLRGLLGRAALGEGEGLLLRPTASIHMFFMRFPIDAVFLDRDLTVLRVAEDVRPWRAASHRGAKAVLEVGAGEARRRGLEPGVRLRLEG
jgi:uncharacterized membrane protein (UPF0127 family)